MEFRETLLAAQRNQQQKSSENLYYKARFDPPKKEQKQKDKLSANIQKFLAKKDEEEKQKKLDALKKRDELLAMRDPKALRKIQKTLKVIKSANKSVIEDAVDRDNTAVTREGPDQPDQDDYGYESQAAAAIYEKMMQKYSKLPEVPKFPTASTSVKKDLNGTRERVKQALQHEDDPVPHKRRRKKEGGEKDLSPPPSNPEPERKEKEKPEKPKIRKPVPPPMDFNQLLKLAEQKKSEPLDVVAKEQMAEPEPERLMTKRQKREFEEEMARRQKRQERMDADKGRKVQKEEKPLMEKPSGFGRIPKIGDKGVNNQRHDSPKLSERDRHEKDRAEKLQRERERARAEKAEKERERLDRDKERADRDKDKAERTDRERFDRDRFDKIKAEKERLDKLRAEKERLEKMKAEKERDIDRLEKLRAERERIERDIDRLNKDRDRLEKEKQKLDSMKNDKPNKPVDRSKIIPKEQRHEQGVKKSIDLKSQNTYRIDKNSNEKRYDSKNLPTQGKPVPKLNKGYDIPKNGVKDKAQLVKQKALSNDRSPRLNGHDRPEGSKTVPKRPEDRKPVQSNAKPQVVPNKQKISNSFDFDKHVNSLGKKPDGSRHPGDVKRKPNMDDRRGQKRRVVNSDSEYDSEMDDFIDDGDEELDYSTHIKEIFGYDKSRYRDMDDDDDPSMESSFARQQREEYISKKIGIMEDLEDMRMEAMEKKKTKKKRRISDD